MENHGGMIRQGKIEELGEPTAMPLCPPQNPILTDPGTGNDRHISVLQNLHRRTQVTQRNKSISQARFEPEILAFQRLKTVRDSRFLEIIHTDVSVIAFTSCLVAEPTFREK
jgi:hypothetical protein